jgi:hypothetical protein
MSRGWESKSIESQMADATTRREASRRILQTAEQIRLQGERESLELSRTRVRHDLDAATHPRRKEQLQAALLHLEKKITALGARG